MYSDFTHKYKALKIVNIKNTSSIEKKSKKENKRGNWVRKEYIKMLKV